MNKNRNLHNAKHAKNDEFYTQLVDIENELKHYKEHFEGKTIFCNCDDPRVSNFFHYFSHNFERLGLKKLITTCYKNDRMDIFSKNDNEAAIYLEYTGTKNKNGVPSVEEIGIRHLDGIGDFRGEECVELLEESDIVCTNPPFSLFKKYIAQLMEYKKKFLIIGNYNAITYKEVFPLIRDNEIWVGVEPWGMTFSTPNGEEKYSRMTKWFTNLDHGKRNKELILVKRYNGNEDGYPKYDNYDAIEVNKVSNIPKDYDGVMGVPITFLVDYNPNQFEILGQLVTTKIDEFNFGYPFINGKRKYARILIRKRKN